MTKMLFSLIIPCHNPEKTIFRLLDSVAMQNVSKDILEVIVVDDNSDSLQYREELKKRYDLNFVFAETNTTVHCPGNTRRKGMEYVSGDWVFFADQDDLFEDDALQNILKFLDENKDRTMYVISTIMRGYDDVNDVCYKDYAHKQAWLHGKWYSMPNLIVPYGVNFKEDLVTHEDIYFNCLCLSKLFKLKKDWEYYDVYTYRWVDNPDSITRRKTKDRGYLYENFNDYLVSAGESFWEEAVNTHNPVFVNQVIMALLHAYFYYEAASYYEGSERYTDIAKCISNYIHRLVDEVKIDLDFIVDFVYADPHKYEKVYEDCKIYSDVFIPKTSFRDFVYKLGGKDNERMLCNTGI